MKKKLLVVKFGGSVITKKNRTIPSFNKKAVEHLSSQVASLFDTGKYNLILVHGAGSFAHPIVKKNNLHLGMKTLKQKGAFAQTVQSMLLLNRLITDQLNEYNLPIVVFPPHAFITQSNKNIKDFDYSTVKTALENNHIPLLFGDMVYDDKLGCSVISGDTIVTFLAQKLKADKVIFLSDVDGIFTKDPKKFADAKLIREINNQNLEDVLEGISANNPHDVTGEMKGKITSIKNELGSIETFIINGLKKNALVNLIRKKLSDCTRLTF
ncbi:isopentenyl phosphate kinase family protein [Candidatus Daviesbacteria bacterium]|nr:isopentenyl phosphate kinase family protein [Candidatus Daviesbacteria bacterium]